MVAGDYTVTLSTLFCLGCRRQQLLDRVSQCVMDMRGSGLCLGITNKVLYVCSIGQCLPVPCRFSSQPGACMGFMEMSDRLLEDAQAGSRSPSVKGGCLSVMCGPRDGTRQALS